MLPAQFYDLRSGPVAINWSLDGDRFLHFLFEELQAEVADVRGHNMSTHTPTEKEPFFYYGFRVTSETLTSRLCLVPTSAGAVHAVVRIEAADDVEAQARPWSHAIERAVARLGEDHPLHQWWAVIGATTDFNSEETIVDATTVSGLTLLPGEEPYLEVVESFVPVMGGGQIHHSYPAVVSGESRGYSFPVAQETAAERLNRLCALVSIAWDGCWQVRQAPQPYEINPSQLPKSGLLDTLTSDESWSRSEVRVPDWLEHGMRKLEGEPSLLQLARAHHQGMAIEVRSPSYAMLAYVAVIEGIGARYVDLSRCECCRQCSVTIGSSKRFRTALGILYPEDEARRLAKVYTKRSLTAHEGKLHGGEFLFGSFPSLRLFTREESLFFRHQQVWPLRRASRELLTLALTDRLSDNPKIL